MEFDITVLKKGHVREAFEVCKINASLLRETPISKSNAKFITEKVWAFIIASRIQLITAPMIREITCVKLLQFGFELEREFYTRIGNPKFDIDQNLEINKTYEMYYPTYSLDTHILEENKGVDKLIQQLKEGEHEG